MTKWRLTCLFEIYHKSIKSLKKGNRQALVNKSKYIALHIVVMCVWITTILFDKKWKLFFLTLKWDKFLISRSFLNAEYESDFQIVPLQFEKLIVKVAKKNHFSILCYYNYNMWRIGGVLLLLIKMKYIFRIFNFFERNFCWL